MTGAKRTIVVTGASSGIGADAAVRLSEQGNDIAVVGRNAERTRDVAARSGGTPFLADFDRLDDVRALAEALLGRYERIDVLVNNAGGLHSKRELTPDGNERTIQSNHLAPFLLTNLLLPRILATAGGGRAVRVVSTSSSANRMGNLRLNDLNWSKRPWLGGWRAYGTSKLATILFISELAERLTGTGVNAYSFHPGVVATSFGATSPLVRFGNAVTNSRWGSTPAEGAVPLIALTADIPVGAPSGTYFDKLRANGPMARQARDAQLGRDLWEASARLVGTDLLV